MSDNNNTQIHISIPRKDKFAFDNRVKKCGLSEGEAIRILIRKFNISTDSTQVNNAILVKLLKRLVVENKKIIHILSRV